MSGLYLIIPAIIILLFALPVFVEIKINFNLLDLTGVFSIFIYGIRIEYYIFRLDKKGVILKNEKETKEKEYSFDSKEVILYEEFGKELKDKTRLKELFVFYNIGVDDAFYSSMVGGIVNAFLLMIFSAVKNAKPTASLGVYDTVSYNRTIFEVAVINKISVSLFDIVYSFIIAVILSRKKINKILAQKAKGEANA